MFPKFLFLKYLLFMNLGAGLVCDFATDHCTALKTGALMRSCNRVMDEAVPAVDEINAIKMFFGSIPFSWAVEETDSETIKVLEQNGLNYKYAFPAMWLDLSKIKSFSYKDNIVIKEVCDESELSTWLSIISVSYPMALEELTKVFVYLKTHEKTGFIKSYLGFYEGNPVAASMMIFHEDAVTLHWVSTLPEYRNKGLGFAISHKPLMDAYVHGFKQAFLLAGNLGESIYKHIGFEKYAMYRMYVNK